eukprot:scaffold163136_cov32-Tisochrysis_lutea.AAC.4
MQSWPSASTQVRSIASTEYPHGARVSSDVAPTKAPCCPVCNAWMGPPTWPTSTSTITDPYPGATKNMASHSSPCSQSIALGSYARQVPTRASSAASLSAWCRE